MLPIGAPGGASTADDALRSSFGGMGKGKHEGVKAYQGGSFKHLHAMLGVTSGSQVLYVGIHLRRHPAKQKDARVANHARGARAAARARVPAARGRAGFPEKLRKLRQRRDALSDAVQLSAWRGRVLAEAADAASEEVPEPNPTRTWTRSGRRMRSARRSRRRLSARRRRTGWACASSTPRSTGVGSDDEGGNQTRGSRISWSGTRVCTPATPETSWRTPPPRVTEDSQTPCRTTSRTKDGDENE